MPGKAWADCRKRRLNPILNFDEDYLKYRSFPSMVIEKKLLSVGREDWNVI